ncbi:MAG TPA: amino acid adenylation domain-containing protein, partial [Thermoanaerobaculia bacterium]|nr:amino acid adenylation domain-containing protein [Thermoanaerobaculia bacterium]
MEIVLIPRLPQQESYASSYSQQAAWLREQLSSGQHSHHTVRVVELAGPLVATRLRQALQDLIDRFDVLRARFTCPGFEPVQSFAAFHVTLPCADLSTLDDRRQVAAARRLLSQAMAVPFDLAAGPLFRFHLLRLARERHLLLLGFHHLVIDGISYDRIFEEVMAFLAGRPLPPPRLQFQDFAAWQRARIGAGELEPSRRYWLERLGGDLPLLELPTDRPRPPAPSYAGASVLHFLEADLHDRMVALARASSTTFFRTLCAALKVFLHRLTGATDIIIGSPFAGRTHPDLAHQVGFFVTTLALRTDLGGDPDFSTALARVNEVVAGAKRHQDYPFEKLLEELALDRNLGRSPVYSVAFLKRPLTAKRRGGELCLTHWEHIPDIAPYDLLVTEAETATGVQVLFYYRPELFDRTTVERWAETFEELLRGVAGGPRTLISELPLLRGAERHQLLVEWGGAPALPMPKETSLTELFEGQVEEDPDAVAVVDGESRLSYGELNRRANRLAHRLRAMGVAPEALVALLFERSSSLIWAILGVLKAGGAYLPLERGDPESRLRSTIEDARPAVLLTDRPAPPALSLPGLARLMLAAADLAAEPTDNPPPWTGPDHLAYVIYTSGSTGGAKGTPICHRNVTRLFRATERCFGPGRGDVWTLFHSAAFDFSVWELWGALLYGGELVIVPYLVSRSPEELRALLVRERVTVLNQTPSAFRQLLAAEEQGRVGDAGRPLALRLVIFGGEAVDLPSVGAWFGLHGDRQPRLVNMYGITETTVHVTYRPLRHADLAAAWRKPIGRALPDLEIFLHDRRGWPVPAGVPGEIMVGGAGLCQGYRGRPGLAAERFVPHPYACRPGERLYRSGDLARWLPDGQLDYLGRIDHQVKVRGFRVELGEIEAALAEQAGVRAAVVLPR